MSLAIGDSYYAVHPHIRGEYGWYLKVDMKNYGSSPHPWGIHTCIRQTCFRRRFIPTSVGNTISSHAPWMKFTGSSPHPWGIRGTQGLSLRTRRFIPTSVGNTSRGAWRTRRWSVHPHIRGEYSVMLSVVSPASGSSPHPWGIP